MHKYLLAFVLLTPLSGIIMMEMGAFSFAAQEVGYENNASLFFLLYIFLFISAYYICGLFNLKFPVTNKLSVNYRNLAKITLIISIVSLFIILVPFKGYQVLIGQVDKGTFRISLGFFGSFAFLLTKLFLPSVLALNGFYYLKTSKRRIDKILLTLNCVLAFVFGASWGYKSTAIFILMPLMIILLMEIKWKQILVIGTLTLVSFILFSMFFDNATEINTNDIDVFSQVSGSNPIEFVLYRLTVLQGDACWKIWDLYINGQLADVSYSKTLVSLIGDGNLERFVGVSKNNYPEFVKYHFGLLITFLCGNSPSAIAEGYNVTGTVFSEGVISGGILGLVGFSIFGGSLTRLVVLCIEKGLSNNLPLLTSISATYFCFNVFSWLNGGGVDTLFHISVITGILIDIVFLTIIVGFSKVLKI